MLNVSPAAERLEHETDDGGRHENREHTHGGDDQLQLALDRGGRFGLAFLYLFGIRHVPTQPVTPSIRLSPDKLKTRYKCRRRTCALRLPTLREYG